MVSYLPFKTHWGCKRIPQNPVKSRSWMFWYLGAVVDEILIISHHHITCLSRPHLLLQNYRIKNPENPRLMAWWVTASWLTLYGHRYRHLYTDCMSPASTFSPCRHQIKLKKRVTSNALLPVKASGKTCKIGHNISNIPFGPGTFVQGWYYIGSAS